MQLTQVLLHLYTYFPVLLFKTANIYVHIGYNKIFGKRGHLGWRNLYKGLNSPPFSRKTIFLYHLKRFLGTKRLGKYIWYKLKRFRGTKLPCKHTQYRLKRFRGTKWTTENWARKWTNQSQLILGKDSNWSQPKSGNDNVAWSTNNWSWDRYLFSEFT